METVILDRSLSFHCGCVLSYFSLSDSLRPMHSSPQVPLSMDSPGKNTSVGCHVLLQEIFLTQGSNQLSHVSCIGRQFLYHWCHLASSMDVIYWKLVLFDLKR